MKKEIRNEETACKLADILSVAEVGVWELDLKTRQVILDNSFCDLVALPHRNDPIDFDDMEKLFYAKEWKFVAQSIEDYINGKKEIYSVEHRLKRADGKNIWVLARGRIAKCGESSSNKLLGSVIDITERKEVEEKLKISEEKYRYLFQHAVDPIVNVDLNGFITESNSAIEKTFGYTPKEIEGQSYLKLKFVPLKTKAIITEKIAYFILNGGNEPYEVEMIRKDGEKRIVRIVSEKIMAENKLVGIQSVFHDVTEERAAEEVLKRRNNELERFYEMSLPDYSKK